MNVINRLERILIYIKRRRVLKYIYLFFFSGYRVIYEDMNNQIIKTKFGNLIFEYPLNNVSYKISVDPKNEILVDSFINCKSGTFIDVGAFIGKYTIKVAKNPNVKVVAIEPNPYSYEFLLKNLNLNMIDNNVIAINKAISDEDDILVKFKVDYAMSKVVENEDKEIITVKTTTLKKLIDYYSLGQPFLIKIDTEGHELKILKSFERYLFRNYNIKIILEILPESKDKGIIIDLMKKNNFSYKQIDYTNYIFNKSNV